MGADEPLFAFFLFRGSLGYIPDRIPVGTSAGEERASDAPFNMHNLRKSAKEHCSFFTAAERVMYAFAAPAFPFCFKRPMVGVSGADEDPREKESRAREAKFGVQ